MNQLRGGEAGVFGWGGEGCLYVYRLLRWRLVVALLVYLTAFKGYERGLIGCYISE